MKKLFIIIVTLMMLMMSMVESMAAEINGVGVADTMSRLNVRSAPEENAQIIGSLSPNEKVNIITKTRGWYKIEYGGLVGFVHSEYLISSRRGEPVILREVTTAQTVEGTSKGSAVVEYAKTFLGIKYVYGGTSPKGFDCSGLVQYVYNNFGVKLNRVAADQTAHGKPVGRGNLQPGDIVFFHNTSRYTRINHVGIYVGNGNFIHSPQTGDVVKITTMDSGYYSNTFITARRIFD